MSDQNHAHDVPALERWMVVLLLSLVPAAAAVFVPDGARMPVFALSPVLIVVALVMLARQRRTARGA